MASLGQKPLHALPETAFPQMPGHTGTRTCWGSWKAHPVQVSWAAGRSHAGDPALAQLCEAAPSRWRGQAGTTACMRGLRREGQACSQMLALQPGSVAWAQHTSSSAKRPWGPWEQLTRIGAGAGQKASVTGTLPSLDIGQGGNILCSLPGKRKGGGKIRLRSYTQNSLLFLQKLCLIHVENHRAFLLFLSMLHPQPVHSVWTSRVGTHVLPEMLTQSWGPAAQASPAAPTPRLSFTFQGWDLVCGLCPSSWRLRGHAQWERHSIGGLRS